MASLLQAAPYHFSKWAETSPVVGPLATGDSTTVSPSSRRRGRFLTTKGVKPTSRSAATRSHRPDVVGQQRLGTAAVAGGARGSTDSIVLVLVGVLGHLVIQGGLDHRVGQRVQQPVRPVSAAPRARGGAHQLSPDLHSSADGEEVCAPRHHPPVVVAAWPVTAARPPVPHRSWAPRRNRAWRRPRPIVRCRAVACRAPLAHHRWGGACDETGRQR